jgi:polar amino acid transport system substrate-binding protein
LLTHFVKNFFFLVVIACGQVALAQEKPNVTSSDVLKMVDGLPKPPFIIEENGQGLQLDIVRAALATNNISVEFIHGPFGRTITTFKRINADGVVTVLPDYQYPGLYISQPFITYQNVAISLAENQFDIEDTNGLSGKNIIAFQNAKKYLGSEFNKAINYSMNYREIADQMQQIDMLFLRRTEVIILDINIFKYFLKNHTCGRFSQAFKVHFIFGERPYSAAFKSEKNRDLFDQGIKTIKAQGLYQRIMDKYLEPQTILVR